VKAIATTLARFVGLASLLYSVTVFFGNVVGVVQDAVSDTPWLLVGLAMVSLTGIGGSIVFLLSFDGPPRFRTRGRRLLGWFGMLICAAMPTNLLYLIGPLVLVGMVTLPLVPAPAGRRRGRHLPTSA
jgi:hypothetical protein